MSSLVLIIILSIALLYIALTPSKENLVVSPTDVTATTSYKPDKFSDDIKSCVKTCDKIDMCSREKFETYLIDFTNKTKPIKQRVDAFKKYTQCITTCAYKCLSNKVSHNTIRTISDIAESMAKVVIDNQEICNNYNMEQLSGECISNLNNSLQKHLPHKLIHTNITIVDLMNKLECVVNNADIKNKACENSNIKELEISEECFDSLKSSLQKCIGLKL